MRFLRVIFILMLISLCFDTKAENWIYINSNVQIDLGSIQKLSNGTIRVGELYRMDQTLIEKMWAEQRKKGDIVDYSDYEISKTFFEVDCKNKLIAAIAGIHFGKNERLIDSWTEKKTIFFSIAPDSIAMDTYKFLCNKKK